MQTWPFRQKTIGISRASHLHNSKHVRNFLPSNMLSSISAGNCNYYHDKTFFITNLCNSIKILRIHRKATCTTKSSLSRPYFHPTQFSGTFSTNITRLLKTIHLRKVRIVPFLLHITKSLYRLIEEFSSL